MSVTSRLSTMTSGFRRAFSLIKPDLMRFLVNECGVVIPPRLPDLEYLLDYAGIRNVDPDEVSRRLEAMKTYLHKDWEAQDVYSDGLRRLIMDNAHENALIFCLENGADPNQFNYVVDRGNKRRQVETLGLLLRYGADLNHPSLKNRNMMKRLAKFQKWLPSGYDISWEELVKRAKAGESLERIGERMRGG